MPASSRVKRSQLQNIEQNSMPEAEPEAPEAVIEELPEAEEGLQTSESARAEIPETELSTGDAEAVTETVLEKAPATEKAPTTEDPATPQTLPAAAIPKTLPATSLLDSHDTGNVDTETDLPLKSAANEAESDSDDYDPEEGIDGLENAGNQAEEEADGLENANQAEEEADGLENAGNQAEEAVAAADSDEYDPETVSVERQAPKNGLPPKPTVQTLELLHAYDAVMKSEIVQLKEFAGLSKEQQMAVIERLLVEKNITLPSEAKKHSVLDTPATADEEREYSESAVCRGSERFESFPENLRLFVGNLPHSVSKFELFRVFSRYGKLAEIAIKSGYGFVQFEAAEDCASATRGEAGVPLHGRVLRLNSSRLKRDPVRARERSAEKKRTDVKIFVCGSELASEVAEVLALNNITCDVQEVEAKDVSDSVQEAAYLGVLGACVLRDGKCDLQTFESTDEGIKFDEYEDVEAAVICSIINSKRSGKPENDGEDKRDDHDGSDWGHRSRGRGFKRRHQNDNGGNKHPRRQYHQQNQPPHNGYYQGHNGYQPFQNQPYPQQYPNQPFQSQPYQQQYPNQPFQNQQYQQPYPNQPLQQPYRLYPHHQPYDGFPSQPNQPNQPFQQPFQQLQPQQFQQPPFQHSTFQNQQVPNQQFQSQPFSNGNPNAAQALQDMDPNTKQNILALLNQSAPAPSASSQVNHLLSQLQGPQYGRS